MKFDAIVGNPPYQEDNDNNSRKAPVYHLFYDVSFKLSNIVTLISPARFLFNAGQTPQEWNGRMLNNEHVKVVDYFSSSKVIFDSVDIKGGVAILLKDERSNFGKIGIFTTDTTIKSIMDKVKISSFQSLSLIIYPKSNYGLTDKLYIDYPELKDRLTEGNTNIIDANIFEKMPEVFIDLPKNDEKYVAVYGRYKNKRIYRYIKSIYIKQNNQLDKYKLFITGANGSGKMGETLSQPKIGKPFVCHTQTFMSIGSFNTEREPLNCLKYVKTKFLRLLLGTLKITQNNPRETWANIPLQDFTEKSDIDWSKSIAEIDKQLYTKYALDDSEIAFIESMIKPME